MLPQEIAPPQTDESPVIIETHDLSRIYPGVVALDNVNYRVYPPSKTVETVCRMPTSSRL